jgi:hypothetical protein
MLKSAFIAFYLITPVQYGGPPWGVYGPYGRPPPGAYDLPRCNSYYDPNCGRWDGFANRGMRWRRYRMPEDAPRGPAYGGPNYPPPDDW